MKKLMNECDGKKCRHALDMCAALSPPGTQGIKGNDGGLAYCLPMGHKGNHIACGHTHNLALWFTEEKKLPKRLVKGKDWDAYLWKWDTGRWDLELYFYKPKWSRSNGKWVRVKFVEVD